MRWSAALLLLLACALACSLALRPSSRARSLVKEEELVRDARGGEGEGEGESEDFQILFMSDIHYDPFGNPRFYDADDFCRPKITTPLSRSGLQEVEANVNETGSERRSFGFGEDGKWRQMELEDEDEEDELRRLESIKIEKERMLLRRASGTDIDPVEGWYGRVGCDTSLHLLNALTDRLSTISTPEWVFITGDTSAHTLTKTPGASAVAVQMATLALHVTFPKTPVYFALGNNDIDVKDYLILCGPSNPWLEFVYSQWKRDIPLDQKDTFLRMGAYSAPLRKGLRLLSLNTVLYSYKAGIHTSEDDPCGQFEWLEEQLETARLAKEKVYIMGHILPGVDSYGYVNLWTLGHNARYFEITTKYRGVIAGQLYGHLHQDEFRVFDNPSESGASQKTSNLVTSAVSPIYGNNPNFRQVRYGDGFRFKDYKVIYLDLKNSNEKQTPLWSELYQYLDTYETSSASTRGLEKVYDQLGTEQGAYVAWYTYRRGLAHVNEPDQGFSIARVCERCAIVSIHLDAFQ